MDLEELNLFLKRETPIELQQKRYRQNVNDQNLPYEVEAIPRMPAENFFKEGNIYISKHHRFSKMPAHTHEFVEFNYMYSGYCKQYINDNEITLKQGQMLLLDKDVIQKIDYMDQDDILINILLKGDSITTNIINNMVKSQSLVSEFMLNASNKSGNHDKFIVFDTMSNEKIKLLVQQLILDNYNKEVYFMRSMNLYLSLILIELTKMLEKQNLEAGLVEEHEMVSILQYIETNFTSVSLPEVARLFGYNSNYLGNKIKKEVGLTFQELINKKKYTIALKLLNETNYTLEEISQRIGYNSVPSIFKLFRKYTDLTPLQIKRKNLMK